jgi:hypothetical protein
MSNIIDLNSNSSNNITTTKNQILSLLIKKQLTNVELDKKLSLADLKRIVNNLPIDIFGDECCIWSGYIINSNNVNKNCYISFFIKNKKKALHRLLYSNFVGELNDKEYLKFTCENKGKCCTLNHFNKIINDEKKEIKPDEIKPEENKEIKPKNNKVFF